MALKSVNICDFWHPDIRFFTLTNLYVFFRRVYDSGEQPVMVLTRQNLTALVIYIVVDDLLED